jgi:hypothetical protein
MNKIERIKEIIKEVDPRNYDDLIREEKWEYYWTDNVSLVNEMFDLVESLMSEDKHDEFSYWCLKATEEDIIDFIKSKVIA